MSIVQELEKKTKSTGLYKKVGLTAFFVVLVAVGAYYRWGGQTEVIPPVVEKAYTVKSGDIRIAIAGEGKVRADDMLDLTFTSANKITAIYKKPGDQVAKGEKIAELDADLLRLAVEKARLSVDQAKATLAVQQNPLSSVEKSLYAEQVQSARINSDMADVQSSIDVSNAKLAMDTAKLNLDILQKELGIASGASNLSLIQEQEAQNLRTKQQDAMTMIGASLSVLDTTLYDIDMTWGISDANKNKNDSFEIYLSAKNTSLKNEVERSWQQTSTAYAIFLATWKRYRNDPDLTSIETYLQTVIDLTRQTNELTQIASDSLQASVSSSTFSDMTINNGVAELQASVAKLKLQTHNLIAVQQGITTASQAMQVKVGTTSNDLTNKLHLATQEYEKAKLQYESAQKKADATKTLAQKQVAIAQANLESKEQTLTKETKKVYELAISQAEKSLQEAQKKLSDVILVAPNTGVIVAINGYVGEVWTPTQTTPFAQLAIHGDAYIEARVEEADVVKVFPGQSVSIEVEAFEGLQLTGKVFFVASAGTVDTNGITLYKILISYKSDDSRVRNGMGVAIDFVTKEVLDVLVIPVKAVKPYNGKPSVKLQDGTYKQITPGFTDNKTVQVLSGLRKGDVILVSE